MQMTCSQVSGVTRPQSIGTRSPISVVQPTGSSGTGFGSQVTVSPYRVTGSQISPVVGSPAPSTHVFGPSTSGSSSDDGKLVWE